MPSNMCYMYVHPSEAVSYIFRTHDTPVFEPGPTTPKFSNQIDAPESDSCLICTSDLINYNLLVVLTHIKDVQAAIQF